MKLQGSSVHTFSITTEDKNQTQTQRQNANSTQKAIGNETHNDETTDLPPVDPILCNVSVYTFLKPHTGYKTQSSNKTHIISQLVTKFK